MSKAIVVFEMPEFCVTCPLRLGSDTCYVKKKKIEDAFIKPDWCPLNIIPDKLPSISGDYYADGWNDCIDKIDSVN